MRHNERMGVGSHSVAPSAGTGLIGRMAATALLAGLTLLPASAVSQTSATPPAQTEVPVSSAVGVNLNITPKRLTFDRNSRSATVYIFNQGSAPATFDIAIIDRVMLPSGDIRPVADIASAPEHKDLAGRLKSAQGLVIASPRRATLAPGKGQTIRIRVSPPPSSASDSGEYRSHLTVTTIPPRDTGLTAEEVAAQRPDALTFRVQSVFGVSIPIIIRPGPVDAQGSISGLRLDYADISPDGSAPAQRTPVLSFDINRTGANSLFGNLEIRGSGSSGNDPIGIARGIGVYPEIDSRSVRIPLRRAPQPGETLEILFIDDDGKPGNVIARSSLTVS